MAEAQLRGEEGMLKKRDPRWEERRRADSDIDWGDEDDDNGDDSSEMPGTGVDPTDNGAGSMDVDPELELDVKAMRAFTKGMNADGARFVTMDDIADEERIRREDEESKFIGSSGDDDLTEDESDAEFSEDAEVNMVVAAEEELMIAEPGDIDFNDQGGLQEDDSSDDDDVDLSPGASFQTRLERLRNKAHEKRDVRSRQSFSEMEDDYDDTIARIEVRIMSYLSSAI